MKAYNKLGLHSIDTEFIVRLMEHLGYIEYQTNKDDTIKSIHAATKGFNTFLDGGFFPEAKRKRNTRRLIRMGQWSTAIVGLYYLTMFIKETLFKVPAVHDLIMHVLSIFKIIIK